MAAALCWRALTPGDRLYHAGTESHLIAATIAAARRTCFKILRRLVEDSDRAGDYQISESPNGCHVRHKPTNTRVSVVAATSKAVLGLIGCPLVVVDEPASYEIEAGRAVWDALATAIGKPESALRLFLIGHLAPRAAAAGHWYFDLVHRGTRGRTWVHFLQADPAKWDRASEIRRVSPLSWRYPASRAKLLEERTDARTDSAARAAFMSYRLNLPTEDEQHVLLTVADWELVCARPVPPPADRPIVGIDLGGGRAWSAAVAIWPGGRVEAVAVAPGIPSIARQEARDRVPQGVYQALAADGVLHVAEGLRVPSPAQLVGLVAPWLPRALYCDRFRLDELRDTKARHVHPRVTRWSESTADIRALRKLAKDGPLAVAPESRRLIAASLAAAKVENDTSGNCRLIKRGTNNQCRDDVAAALTLAAGAVSRLPVRRPVRMHVAA